MEWWRNELGELLLSDVTTDVIVTARDKLLKRTIYKDTKLSPSSANRYVAALSHAFTIAINEWEWIKRSPIPALKKLTEPQGRIRFLTEVERSRLLDTCRNSQSRLLYSVVVIALSTGARRGEILGLKWADVDLNNGRLIFHDTKNGERRGVALKGHALDILKELRGTSEDGSEFLFPNRAGTAPIDIRTPWETAVKKASLVDFTFHDLRHTAASYLAMGGATPHEIAEVLGHKSLEMTRRYAHLSKTHVDGVVKRMNEKMYENED